MTDRKALLEIHEALTRRNRDLEIDPVLGFQAEHTMVRIERMFMCGGPVTHCVTCGDEIPEGRRKACPEAIWCVGCSTNYEVKRRKPWTMDASFGRRL